MHRPRWEGRFAGTRRTCYNHLVSAATNWHLPWWLFLLALQWMVVALLDIGARLLNYRVAIRSYCETLPLLGEETPTAASTAAIGRWMTRWLRRSHDGARRHLNHSLRTLARALLVLSTYLLYHLSTHGISGLTRGMLGWLETWLVTILLPLPRRTSDALRAAHSIFWLCQLNATYRGLIVLARLQDILGWFLFASRFALALLAVAWQHWTGPRALSVTSLPRAARSRPEASAVAVAAATAAATAATALQPPQPHSPPSPPSETTGDLLHPALAAAAPLRGRVGYALKLRHGKTRAKVKESRALPAHSEAPISSFWSTRHPVTRWLRVVIDTAAAHGTCTTSSRTLSTPCRAQTS